MADFKAITTQEEFDAAIKERIDRAEKKTRETVAAEYAGWMKPEDVKRLKEEHATALKELNESHAKALEKYAGYDDKFNEMTAKVHEYEVREIKNRVAREKKLPYEAVDFLQGDDEKAITESADRLANLTGTTHSFGMTRNTETTANTDNVWRELAHNVLK